MRWFQHETDAHRDTKIKKLINEYGSDGYAVYFYCLELIAGDLDSDNITFELEDDAELIGQYLKVDTLRVEKIMKKCLELELFGINEYGKINCIKMAKFLSADYTRNPKLKKLITGAKMNKVYKKLSADSRRTVGRLSAVTSATLHDMTLHDITLPNNIIDEIYKLYPSKDTNHNNKSTSKGSGDKTKIASLIKSGKWTAETLMGAQRAYLDECARTKTWLKNYKTFLNNIPEPVETAKPKDRKAEILKSIREKAIDETVIKMFIREGEITQAEADSCK